MAVATKAESLAEPLDRLIRGLIDHVSGCEQVEAFANLVTGLRQLDYRRGHRTAAIAHMVFWTECPADTNPAQFPWRPIEISVSLDADDCAAMLTSASGANVSRPPRESGSADDAEQVVSVERNDDEQAVSSQAVADPRDARAAVYFLQAFGGGITSDADTDSSPIELSTEATAAFCDLAAAEIDPNWRLYFTNAAVKAQAVSLLPWLVRTADLPETAEHEVSWWTSDHGRIDERHLADFLRSIGYLTRQLLDDKQPEAAHPGIEALDKRRPLLKSTMAFQGNRESESTGLEAHRTDSAPHRSIVIGLVTGLGYLGDWQPILEQLGPGEPWLHRAAKNVFKHWVPGPLAAAPDQENERAAVWIANRLQQQADLPHEVRSTLQEIHASLEQKLGRHIRPNA